MDTKDCAGPDFLTSPVATRTLRRARDAIALVSDSHRQAATNSGIRGCLDSPKPGQNVYDQVILLTGWVYAPGLNPASCRVRAHLDDAFLGETRFLFHRADVSAELGLETLVPTGFRLLGRLSIPVTAPQSATLRVEVAWADGLPRVLTERQLQVLPAFLDARPYGVTIQPDNPMLLHREHIYGSGPPLEAPGVQAARLIHEYLPESASIVDVGCGAGAYAPGLIAAGHDWVGLEADACCLEILGRRQLPFRRVLVDSHALPGDDEEWDCALCVEVLEHLAAPELMVREIARVCRDRALFSVPNIEVLSYLHDWGVVPWHLLEADHRNFFTRGSLRQLLADSFRQVEVFSYHEHPLRTRDDLAVHLHLFAIADK